MEEITLEEFLDRIELSRLGVMIREARSVLPPIKIQWEDIDALIALVHMDKIGREDIYRTIFGVWYCPDNVEQITSYKRVKEAYRQVYGRDLWKEEELMPLSRSPKDFLYQETIGIQTYSIPRLKEPQPKDEEWTS